MHTSLEQSAVAIDFVDLRFFSSFTCNINIQQVRYNVLEYLTQCQYIRYDYINSDHITT